MIHIDIAIQSDGWKKHHGYSEKDLYKLANKALGNTFEHLGLENTTSELSLVFTDDAEIRKINVEWRNKDKATNVLSFPAFPIIKGQHPGPLLGDIIIAEETVCREAQEENKEFEHHLLHLIVHGLLHLIGYDHENDAQAEEMEQLEREILQTLAIADPYAVSMK